MPLLNIVSENYDHMAGYKSFYYYYISVLIYALVHMMVTVTHCRFWDNIGCIVDHCLTLSITAHAPDSVFSQKTGT